MVITPYAAAVAVCTVRVWVTQKLSPSVRDEAGSSFARPSTSGLRPWPSSTRPSRCRWISSLLFRNQTKPSRRLLARRR